MQIIFEGINGHNISSSHETRAYIGLYPFENVHYSYSDSYRRREVLYVELSVLKEMLLENHEVLLMLNEAFGKSVDLIMNKIICLNQKIYGTIAEPYCILPNLQKRQLHMS